MNPVTTQLKQRLDERLRWLHNKWFFKWHHVGEARGVEIDMFDGTTAQYAGIGYVGSPRQIFWDAITRGVRREVVEQLSWVEQQVRAYDHETASTAIDECTGQLISFARTVRRAAVEKDRILRGDGINFPEPNDAGHWDGATDRDIKSQGEALRATLPKPRRGLHAWIQDKPFWPWAIGTSLAIVGLLATAYGLLT